MISVAEYKNKTVVVLGLARTGISSARALSQGGARVLVWDDNFEVLNSAKTHGFETFDINEKYRWSNVSLLVVSPGIPHLYPFTHTLVKEALSHEVIINNDIGLFFSYFMSGMEDFERSPEIIAITGSNGKSTTASLIHHIISKSGRKSQLAGNIGKGVFDIEPLTDGEVLVLELSSYQLDLARQLSPDIAIFTNFSADHIDRHGGIGGYFLSKRRLFMEGNPEKSIININSTEGLMLANQISGSWSGERLIRVGSGPQKNSQNWSIFHHKGHLVEWNKSRQIYSIDLRSLANLPGDHNYENICSAYAACRILGLPPRDIGAGLQSFKGLIHRTQIVDNIAGVLYVNDSKATNADSASKALQAFKNILWICGGEQKIGGLEILLSTLGAVKKAYIIGNEAALFALNFKNLPCVICQTMEKAFQLASTEADRGDVVLLSPAAASFDQYDNFEKRGEHFINLVEELSKKSASSSGNNPSDD
jgi:UDP-N-acetylmuramoylalanine--D-glutamate ligase